MANSHDTSLKTVAILTQGEALSALLQMVLSAHRHLRVRVFANVESLSIYMRITPIDLLICELGAGAEGAVHLVPELIAHSGNKTHFQTIALATDGDAPTKALCERAGIDEVVFKPMSPRYLEERVLARLERPMRRRLAEDVWPDRRRMRPSRAPRLNFPLPDNVIPLFGGAPEGVR